MEVNDYFGHRRTNGTHATPNYGTGKSKFEIDYYIQALFSEKKKIQRNLEKAGKELIYSIFKK